MNASLPVHTPPTFCAKITSRLLKIVENRPLVGPLIVSSCPLLCKPKRILTILLANKSFFDYAYADDKPMGTRFGQAMIATSSSLGPFKLVELYEPLLSAPKGTILVDVGGGIGHIAIAAAQKYPNLKCVVQDIGMVVNEGRDGLPEELKDRVEFQENDFFKGQPIGGPGVFYYLKHILHDHPDPWVSISSVSWVKEY